MSVLAFTPALSLVLMRGCVGSLAAAHGQHTVTLHVYSSLHADVSEECLPETWFCL